MQSSAPGKAGRCSATGRQATPVAQRGGNGASLTPFDVDGREPNVGARSRGRTVHPVTLHGDEA